MKKVFSFALCMVVLMGCTKPLKPVDEETEEPQEVATGQTLFSRYQEQFSFQLWPEAEVEDASLAGPGWSFSAAYENLAEKQRNNPDWRTTFDIPSAELSMMSTRNLMRTCYIYPYNLDWLAYDDDYLGVLVVISRFNGWRELMRRKQAPEELLQLFKEVKHPDDPGGNTTPLNYTEYLNSHHNYYGIEFLALVISTAVDYHKFTRAQAAQLAGEVKKKLSEMLDNTDYYSYVGHLRMDFLLGSFLACRYDDGLSVEDRQILSDYMDPYSLAEKYGIMHSAGLPIKQDPATGYWVVDDDAIAKAMSIIIDSLDRLK